MAIILGIDTSTQHCSVALVNGSDEIATAASHARTHSEKLISLIDEVLSTAKISLANLDGIAIGAGPGSFTGLRIGMATVKGLCYAADKPMWAVSSLAALASEAASTLADPRTPFVAVLDAHRKEVFAAAYQIGEDGGIEALTAEVAIPPSDLLEHLQATNTNNASFQKGAIAVGAGAILYTDVLTDDFAILVDAAQVPSATWVARLAQTQSPESSLATAAPVYIRKSEAEIRYPDGNPGGSYAPIK